MTAVPCEGWKDLPLDKVTQPVALLPQSRGGWMALFSLPDGRVAQLVLEPVGK